MTTYNTPEEPAGPVWDKDGRRWVRLESGTWLRDGAIGTYSVEWYLLLHRNGPMTDTPPAKVGDKVSLTEFSKMPEGSVASASWDVYILYRGRVFTDAQAETIDLAWRGDDMVTVLRVGNDEE